MAKIALLLLSRPLSSVLKIALDAQSFYSLLMIDDAARIRIERNPADLPGRIILRDGDKDILVVQPARNSEVILDPGTYSFRIIFEVCDGHADLPALEIEPRGRITLSVSLLQTPPERGTATQPYSADVNVIIDAPRPWPTKTTQFWVGHADDSVTFWAMFGERAFPEPQTEEEEWQQDDLPISHFAETQGEIFIDHDYTEGAYVGKDGLWLDRVRDHSWGTFWAEEVLIRARNAGHPAPNAFFMCGCDSGGTREAKRQINDPKDIDTNGVQMAYIGEVTHRIE